MGPAPSPSSLRQVANQKVTSAVSAKSTPVPSQAAFADPDTSHVPQEVKLELTPDNYVAINCVVAYRQFAVGPADQAHFRPGLLTQW